MNHKKIVWFLTVILLVVLTVPAFAAETEIDVDCTLPEINVTVPGTGSTFLNPYKIPVEIDGESVTDQIICETTCIENESQVPLQVDVSTIATIKTGSTMTLSSTSTAGTSLTSKKAFLYLEMKRVNDPESITWDKAYDPDKHLVISTATRSKKNMVTLAASGKDGCYSAFRLNGDCVAKPSKAWNAKDIVTVKITFTFNALPVSAQTS